MRTLYRRFFCFFSIITYTSLFIDIKPVNAVITEVQEMNENTNSNNSDFTSISNINLNEHIYFYNLNTYNEITEEKTDDNNYYAIEGFITSQVDNFKINGEDVLINLDNSFTIKVLLKPGENTILLTCGNNSVSCVINYITETMSDITPPTINLNKLNGNEKDNILYTNDSAFIISGFLNDDLTNYNFFINDSLILSSYNNEGENLYREFNELFFLQEGMNSFKLYAIDENSNYTEKIINVYYKTTAPSSPNILKEINDDNSFNTSIFLNEDYIDYIEYSFDGTNFITYNSPIVISSTTTIYTRAVDYFGNISAIYSEKIEVKTETNNNNNNNNNNNTYVPEYNYDNSPNDIIDNNHLGNIDASSNNDSNENITIKDDNTVEENTLDSETSTPDHVIISANDNESTLNNSEENTTNSYDNTSTTNENNSFDFNDTNLNTSTLMIFLLFVTLIVHKSLPNLIKKESDE